MVYCRNHLTPTSPVSLIILKDWRLCRIKTQTKKCKLNCLRVCKVTVAETTHPKTIFSRVTLKCLGRSHHPTKTMKKELKRIFREERGAWKRISSLSTLLRVSQDWKTHNRCWRVKDPVSLLPMSYPKYKRQRVKERRWRVRLVGQYLEEAGQQKTPIINRLISLINGTNPTPKSWLRGVLADTKLWIRERRTL